MWDTYIKVLIFFTFIITSIPIILGTLGLIIGPIIELGGNKTTKKEKVVIVVLLPLALVIWSGVVTLWLKLGDKLFHN